GGGLRRGPAGALGDEAADHGVLADVGRAAHDAGGAGGVRGADGTGDGGAGTDRAGPVERGDRRAAGGGGVGDQDACEPDPGEAGAAGPYAGGGVRVRGEAGHTGVNRASVRSWQLLRTVRTSPSTPGIRRSSPTRTRPTPSCGRAAG